MSDLLRKILEKQNKKFGQTGGIYKMSLLDKLMNEDKGGQDWSSLLELYLQKEMYRLIRDALEDSSDNNSKKISVILNSKGFLEKVQKIVSDSVPEAIKKVNLFRLDGLIL